MTVRCPSPKYTEALACDNGHAREEIRIDHSAPLSVITSIWCESNTFTTLRAIRYKYYKSYYFKICFTVHRSLTSRRVQTSVEQILVTHLPYLFFVSGVNWLGDNWTNRSIVELSLWNPSSLFRKSSISRLMRAWRILSSPLQMAGKKQMGQQSLKYHLYLIAWWPSLSFTGSRHLGESTTVVVCYSSSCLL